MRNQIFIRQWWLAFVCCMGLSVITSEVWAQLENTKIVFTSNRDGNDEIYTMDADGTNATRLTNNAGSDSQPAWSPDRNVIAFISNRDGNNEIYTIHADGTNETRLTTNAFNDQLLAWSPDGTMILFNSNRDGDWEVYKMNADGSGSPVKLTDNSGIDDFATTWSPDGTMVAFHSNRDGNFEIYKMDADGNNVTRLTNQSGTDVLASWSPDGTKISFNSNRDGNNEVYTMDAVQGDAVLTRLTNNTGNDVQALWSPFPVEISIADKSQDEGDNGIALFDFAVTLNRAAQIDVMVDYATADGSATVANNDYNAASNTLTIPAGQTSGTVQVEVNGDTDTEPDEAFLINLSNPIAAIISDSQGEGTITNDDTSVLPVLTLGEVLAVPGTSVSVPLTVSDLPTGGIIGFGIEIQVDPAGLSFTGLANEAVSITPSENNGVINIFWFDIANPLQLADGAKIADLLFDYTAGIQPVTINSSELTDENGAVIPTVSHVNGQVTPITTLISISDAQAPEGSPLTFTVQLDEASGQDVMVDYDTADDTAEAGSDYTAVNGTLTIPAGETSTTIEVQSTLDETSEPSERFFVNLSNPINGTIQDPQGEGIINEDGLPWSFVTTDHSHVISIPINAPEINGQPLDNGDAIGVFFNRDNTLVNGGFVVWTGEPTAVVAMGNSSTTETKDGFDPGEPFWFKIWDASEQVEHSAIAVFDENIGPSVFQSGGLSRLISLISTTIEVHPIALQPGWQTISSYLIPAIPDIQDVLNDILADLVIIKHGAEVYWPSEGVNTIGNWDIRDGYQIMVTNPTTLSLTGHQVDPLQTPIPLVDGWNTIAYLRNTPMDADVALASIVSDIVIVKRGSQVYWPAEGINTIGTLKPCDGYQVLVSNPTSLTYPANDPPGKSVVTTDTKRTQELRHYPVHLNTGNSHTILIRQAEGALLNDGDEIAAWTQSGVYVGAGIWQQGAALITVWGDDPYSQIVDGSADGEALRFTVWKADTKNETELLVDNIFDYFNNRSAEQIIYQINGVTTVTVRSKSEPPRAHNLQQNYPNPFNPSTQIAYDLPEAAHVTLAVYNLLGQEVIRLVDTQQAAGRYEVTWDGRNDKGLAVASGVYVYRLVSSAEYTESKRMMLLK